MEPEPEAGRGVVEPAAWKTSMLVLLILYPLVFAFDVLAAPSLSARGAPLWLSLFVSNVFCVTLLGFLVPWVSRQFAWWLAPRSAGRHVDVLGAGLLVGLYAALLLVFASVSSVR